MNTGKAVVNFGVFVARKNLADAAATFQFTRAQRVRTISSFSRPHSSAASVLRVDEDDDDGETDIFTAASTTRLQDLRRRLKEDSSSDFSQFKTRSYPKSIPRKLEEPPPVPTLPEASKIDLKYLVGQLPDVDFDRVLTDTFSRKHTYLRLSLTERCNLRCTYCMPEAGVPLQPPEHLLQTPELLRIAEFFRSAGVRKFRLTGGEPSLRKDLLDVVRGLNDLGPDQIGMTTNGIQLHRQLPDLVDAGLNSVNISLDTTNPEKFGKLTRRPPSYLNRVWETLDVAHDVLGNGRGSVKLNCVIMRGVNDHEVADFVNLTEKYPNLAVRFIEYMPFSENGWNWEKCVPYRELLDRLPEGMITAVPISDPHDTTKWFETKSGGRVGFITSMSSHFCSGCNRLRLSADGQIKVCLFDGHTEISLRDALRDYDFNDQELGKLVHYAVQKKKFSLGGHRDPQDIMNDSANNRPMTLIGG